MGLCTIQRTCTYCQQRRPFDKQGTSNLFHLVMSVLTVGIWIPVWILCALLNGLTPFRCRMCGQSKYL